MHNPVFTWIDSLGVGVNWWARVRHFCHVGLDIHGHPCTAQLEGSAASGEWEDLHEPWGEALIRIWVLNSCTEGAIVSLYSPADFYDGAPLISMQVPLPNHLTLFTIKILGYLLIYLFLRHLGPIFFKKTQKQRLVIIWYLKLNAGWVSFTWFCSLEWWVAHKLCWCYWEAQLEQLLDPESLVLKLVCILRPVVSQNKCQHFYLPLSHLGLRSFAHRVKIGRYWYTKTESTLDLITIRNLLIRMPWQEQTELWRLNQDWWQEKKMESTSASKRCCKMHKFVYVIIIVGKNY